MDPKVLHYKSGVEKNNLSTIQKFHQESPIPESEILENLGLYITRQNLTRILFMHDIYKKILNTNGVIMEFGTRWGQNLALFNNFRGIYEPYNFTRKVIGFDTFSGFVATDEKDGKSQIVDEGNYNVTENYPTHLQELLIAHEGLSPISHIRKTEVIKGDAIEKVEDYLKDNPQTIIALAYFDFDLYKPTLEVLKSIKPYLTKGSIVAFDELLDPDFPGETVALREVFNINEIEIKRVPYNSYPSYFQL